VNPSWGDKTNGKLRGPGGRSSFLGFLMREKGWMALMNQAETYLFEY